MSLQRLIDLAKRTGDRLIIHDPVNGRDIVLMDIDSYEDLLDAKDEAGFDPSSGSFNDDISFDPTDDDEVQDSSFDEPFAQGIRPTPAPWEEPSPWHQAGSILEDRYDGDWSKRVSDEEYDGDGLEEGEDEDDEDEEDLGLGTLPFDGDERSHQPVATPIVTPIVQPAQIPQEPTVTPVETWAEEPLTADEPVFYEEPV